MAAEVKAYGGDRLVMGSAGPSHTDECDVAVYCKTAIRHRAGFENIEYPGWRREQNEREALAAKERRDRKKQPRLFGWLRGPA